MHMRSDERFAVAAGVVRKQKEVRRVQGGDVENEGKGVNGWMRGSEEGM